jgi:Zn-dependent protease with chaperone function
MYLWLGICTALALLLALYTLGSLAVAGSWRWFHRLSAEWSSARRANLLFGLRVFPAALAISFVGCIAVPAYLVFEPHETGEDVGLKLLFAAALAACVIAVSAQQTLSAWVRSRRLTAEWMRAARPALGLSIPAYRFDHGFPIMAVTGILHPRLFIARQVLDCMQPEEISAAIRHEMGHLEARDNLRRFILHLLPNFAGLFGGGDLDAEWAEASEVAADARAARCGRGVALDLASALIKAARMAPVGVSGFCSPLLPAGPRSGLARRVQRLTTLAEQGASSGDRPGGSAWSGLATVLGFTLLSIFWASPACLHAAHELVEGFVQFLS